MESLDLLLFFEQFDLEFLDASGFELCGFGLLLDLILELKFFLVFLNDAPL